MAQGTIRIITPQRDIAFTTEGNIRRPVVDRDLPTKAVQDGQTVNFDVITQGGAEIAVNIQPLA